MTSKLLLPTTLEKVEAEFEGFTCVDCRINFLSVVLVDPENLDIVITYTGEHCPTQSTAF
jgi:hypothetical protein